MPEATLPVQIYNAGGAALNLGPRIASPYANACYIDTSEANRTDQLDLKQVYNIPLPPVPEENGVKRKVHRGAGQDRKRIAKACTPHIGTIINQFPPADFNIVVFSASGGSGSVLGPLLVKALLAQGQTVVVVTIGDSSSAKYLENTINTLKSLESISVAAGAPVLTCYNRNQAGVPQKTIDDEVLFAIATLIELASQDNHGLDTQDVHNWVNYNAVAPSVPAQLTALSIYDNRQEASKMLEPISILSLYTDLEDAIPFGTPYYIKAGVPRNPSGELPEQLHFVTSHMMIADVFKGLLEEQTAMNRTFASYRSRAPIVNVDDNMDDSNLVF